MGKKATGVKPTDVAAPKNLDEVNVLIGEIGAIDRVLTQEKARLETLIARLRSLSALRLQGTLERKSAVQKAVARYARRHRNEILPENRKSIELSFGTLGWRFDPWKVVLTGEEDTVITWIEVNKMPRFLRHKVELNREQLLEEKPEDIPDIHFEQKERFFVEPRQETTPDREQTVVSLLRVA